MSSEETPTRSTERLQHPLRAPADDRKAAAPAGSEMDGAAGPPRPPDRIGRYRILSILGMGGMGIVYEAEQESPRRRVALKVVRGGQAVDEVHARMFQREIDTLARIQHPHIASIYESGRTGDGQPFFAMELVQGSTLDMYLRGRGPAASLPEVGFRLALFRRITDAVHAAHQRGIIHRDLKPANMIVSAESSRDDAASGSSGAAMELHLPEIKILDFGLARLVESDLQQTTVATEVGVIKGTLSYMAPEQALGRTDQIDVRTDVYALGVILYEMLSGRRPYEVTGLPVIEALRVIGEADPVPLRRTVRGSFRLDPDVETIVRKALAKDADRRYASAAALSQDVTRYLTSQPILARPPSAAYQLRKFAGRNRILVSGVAATLLAVVGGAVVATMFGMREAAERRQAERARRDLEAVVEFQSSMLSDLDPEGVGRRLMADLETRAAESLRSRGMTEQEARGARERFAATLSGVNATSVALRLLDDEILARAARTAAEQFEDRPEIEARLRDTLGETSAALGLDGRAAEQLERALTLRTASLGGDHPDTLTSMDHLADVRSQQGLFAEAEELARQALVTRTRVLGPQHQDTLVSANTLATVLTRLGRVGEAEVLYTDTLAAQRQVLGEEHPDVATSLNNLGILNRTLGRFETAERQLRDALELRRRVLGPERPETLATLVNLASAYSIQGRHAEAATLYRELLATQSRVLGGEHPSVLSTMNNLALAVNGLGRLQEAEDLHLQTLASRRKVLGVEHPDTLVSMNNLSNLYVDSGRLAEAERLDEEVLAIRRRVLGAEHPDTLVSMNNLAVLYRDTGRADEAEMLLVAALEARVRASGPAHPETDRVRRNLVELLRRAGRDDDLRPLVADQLESARIKAVRADARPQEINDYAWQLLTVEPADLRDAARALEFAQRACAEETARGGSELWNYLDTLAVAWMAHGDLAAAIETEEKALALLPEDRPERVGLRTQLELFRRRQDEAR